MAFGRKKSTSTGVSINQDNVATLAADALKKVRASRVQLVVRFTFTAPFLMSRWTTKALTQMLGNMTGHEMPKGSKNLREEYENSWYRNQDGKLAIPCRIVKACIIEGAISTGGLTSKAELKRELRVMGHTAPIHVVGGEQTMDVRLVRNSNGSPDVRARATIPAGSWFECVLQFPPTLTPDKVVAAVEGGGSTIGLCEWRPQRGGELGTFDIEITKSDATSVAKVVKACSVPEESFNIPEYLMQPFMALAASEKATKSVGKAKALIDHVNGQNGAST